MKRGATLVSAARMKKKKKKEEEPDNVIGREADSTAGISLHHILATTFIFTPKYLH